MKNRDLIKSIIFHVALLAMIWIGLPFWDHDTEIVPQGITVEVLPIAEVANIKPSEHRKAPRPKPEKPKKEMPTPPEKQEVKKENIEKVEKQVAEQAPPPKPTEAPRITETAPAPQEANHAKDAQDLDALEKTLEKQNAPASEGKDTLDDLEKDILSASSTSYNAALPLSQSEVGLIRQQIEQCWDLPIGAKGLTDMKVEVRINFGQDGTATAVRAIGGSAGGQSDAYFKVFAESAVRAVWKCSPLKQLPSQEKYTEWAEVEILFSPQQ